MRQEWWKPCSKFRESLLKCFITYRVTTRCSIEWQTPFALPSSATCICYNKQLKRRMRFGDFWRHKGTEGRVIKTIFLFSLRNIQRHFHWETYHTMSTKREKEKKDIFFFSQSTTIYRPCRHALHRTRQRVFKVAFRVIPSSLFFVRKKKNARTVKYNVVYSNSFVIRFFFYDHVISFRVETVASSSASGFNLPLVADESISGADWMLRHFGTMVEHKSSIVDPSADLLPLSTPSAACITRSTV